MDKEIIFSPFSLTFLNHFFKDFNQMKNQKINVFVPKQIFQPTVHKNNLQMKNKTVFFALISLFKCSF